MQMFQEILNSIKKFCKRITIFFIVFNLAALISAFFLPRESRIDLIKIGFIVNLVIIGIFQVSFDLKKKVEKGDTSILATEKQKREAPIIKVIGIILMILNIIGTILILCTQSLYSIYFELIVVGVTFMLGLVSCVRYSKIHKTEDTDSEDSDPFAFIWAVALSIIIYIVLTL